MFMDDRTVAQIAPSGDFGNTLTINCDNPLMSASQKSEICTSDNMVMGYLGNYPVVPAIYATLNPTTQSQVTPASNNYGLFPAAAPQRRRRRSHQRPSAHRVPHGGRFKGRTGSWLGL
jgi:hypothetical protein